LGNDWPTIYKEVNAFFKPFMIEAGGTMAMSDGGISTGGWKWDKNFMGTGIEISNNGTSVFLKEGPYMFRTVFGDIVLEFRNL
jgi:hypothetical protein